MPFLDLIEETINHFNEGAKSVRAYSPDFTYIITRIQDTDEFWIVVEEQGFNKKRSSSLEEYYSEVFGIEAKY
jgi:hypothetical protein